MFFSPVSHPPPAPLSHSLSFFFFFYTTDRKKKFQITYMKCKNTNCRSTGVTHRTGGLDQRMIYCGSLLEQLFTLIILMKHLISPRVLQTAGFVCGPILIPLLTRISQYASFVGFSLFFPLSLNLSFVLSRSFLTRFFFSFFSFRSPTVSVNNDALFRCC